MRDRVFTTKEKIRGLQYFIDDLMWSRSRPDRPEHFLWLILKSIAADLNAYDPTAQDKAVAAVKFQVECFRRAKAEGRIGPGNHEALSAAVLHHWDALSRLIETRNPSHESADSA